MSKTTTNVLVKEFPEEVWRNFKIKAMQQNKQVREALLEAVKEWCENNAAK